MMKLQSAIIFQLIIELSKCSNIAENKQIQTSTYEVMMISQDVQGREEMQLMKCMAWTEQHEESTRLQLSLQFGNLQLFRQI